MKFGEIKKGKFLIVRVVFNLRNGWTKYWTDYFKVFHKNTVTLITTVKKFCKTGPRFRTGFNKRNEKLNREKRGET